MKNSVSSQSSPGTSPYVSRRSPFMKPITPPTSISYGREDDEDPFQNLPIPKLHWWSPFDWPVLLVSPLNPTPPSDLVIQSWDFIRWKAYEARYRSSIATEFARFLIIPTSLLNLLLTIRFGQNSPAATAGGVQSNLWRWGFLFIPFTEELLGDLLLSPYPFLMHFFHDLIGFIAAVLPLMRLVSPSKMSLHTSLWCWYFSFLNSLVIISSNPDSERAYSDSSMLDFVDFNNGIMSRQGSVDFSGFISREGSVRDFRDFGCISREGSVRDFRDFGCISRESSIGDLRDLEKVEMKVSASNGRGPSMSNGFSPSHPPSTQNRWQFHITAGEHIRDRAHLCKQALQRTLDHLKWPLFVAWMVGSLLLGPFLTTIVIMGLVVKIVVGKLKR